MISTGLTTKYDAVLGPEGMQIIVWRKKERVGWATL
jgi:hypothetical protein